MQLLFFCLVSLGSQKSLGIDYGEGPKKVIPTRHVSVIISKEGYYPNNITVFKGEKVRFFVTSTVDKASCLTLSEKDVFISAYKGEISEAETYFESTGEYKIYCPAGKIQGTVTVLGPKEESGRSLASERPSVWMPREE